MSEKHTEAFRAKNERRRGLSGMFGREKPELTARALPSTYKEG